MSHTPPEPACFSSQQSIDQRASPFEPPRQGHSHARHYPERHDVSDNPLHVALLPLVWPARARARCVLVQASPRSPSMTADRLPGTSPRACHPRVTTSPRFAPEPRRTGIQPSQSRVTSFSEKRGKLWSRMRRPFSKGSRAHDLTRRFNLQGGFHNEMRKSPDFGGFLQVAWSGRE